MDYNETSICSNIRAFRRISGLSQGDVAKACGVSIQAVSKWEHARSLPDLRFLPTLAALFDVAIDELFYGKSDGADDSSSVRGRLSAKGKMSEERTGAVCSSSGAAEENTNKVTIRIDLLFPKDQAQNIAVPDVNGNYAVSVKLPLLSGTDSDRPQSAENRDTVQKEEADTAGKSGTEPEKTADASIEPDDNPSLIDSGMCGPAAEWRLHDDGTLEISGSGPMDNYARRYQSPWSPYIAKITKLKLSEGITAIGAFAFMAHFSLTGPLELPSTLRVISRNAFCGCCNLTGSLAIPDGVTRIENWAFESCWGFDGALTIPDSVTEIGDYAFQSDTGFTGALLLPENVASIGKSAFYFCVGFTGDLRIPHSVTRIDDGAFAECKGIPNVYFDGDVPETGASVFGRRDDTFTVHCPAGGSGWPEHGELWNGYRTAAYRR